MADSWLNAPPLFEIAATQLQIPGYSCQVWGITQDYQLITSILGPPLTPWSPWSTPDWDGAPDQIFGVAACQQGNGVAQVFLLDNEMQLWTAWQSSDGSWSNFAGPNWNGAPPLKRICASAQGGGRGAQVFGITDTGSIVTCYQELVGIDFWSSWSDFGGPNPCIWITASLQNDPRVQVFALEERQATWTNYQTAPGNGWSGFEGPNFNSQPGPFQMVTTVAQGGPRGAQVWGVDLNNALWTCFEQVSGDDWSAWGQFPPFDTSTPFVRIAAAQLASGEVMFWGIDTELSLWAVQQQNPGGSWGPWVNS